VKYGFAAQARFRHTTVRAWRHGSPAAKKEKRLPDTNFIAAYADHPLTLAILMITIVIVVYIWKIGPFYKDIIAKLRSGNQTTNEVSVRIDALLKSDEEQTKAIYEIKDQVKHNNLDLLRLNIYNENLDIEDRLVTASRYFIQGGNGKVAEYTKSLIAEHPHVWRTIVAMVSKPEKEKLKTVLGEVA
jgi:hypothetical protein